MDTKAMDVQAPSDGERPHPSLSLKTVRQFYLPVIPEDEEIFAGCPLVVGEDRDAYKRLFLQGWLGLGPRDGYEIELLRQMVNAQWSIRRLTRLSGRQLSGAADFHLRQMVQNSRYAVEHWGAETVSRTEELNRQLTQNHAGAIAKAKEILKGDGTTLDNGVLFALEGEDVHIRQGEIYGLIGRYNDLVNDHMLRLQKYRRRQAALWYQDRGDK